MSTNQNPATETTPRTNQTTTTFSADEFHTALSEFVATLDSGPEGGEIDPHAAWLAAQGFTVAQIQTEREHQRRECADWGDDVTADETNISDATVVACALFMSDGPWWLSERDVAERDGHAVAALEGAVFAALDAVRRASYYLTEESFAAAKLAMVVANQLWRDLPDSAVADTRVAVKLLVEARDQWAAVVAHIDARNAYGTEG